MLLALLSTRERPLAPSILEVGALTARFFEPEVALFIQLHAVRRRADRVPVIRTRPLVATASSSTFALVAATLAAVVATVAAIAGSLDLRRNRLRVVLDELLLDLGALLLKKSMSVARRKAWARVDQTALASAMRAIRSCSCLCCFA